VTFHLQAAQQGLTCQRVMHVSSLRSSIAILMVAVVFAITYRYLHLGRFEELGLRLQDLPAFWPDPQVHFYASHVFAPQNSMKPPNQCPPPSSPHPPPPLYSQPPLPRLMLCNSLRGKAVFWRQPLQVISCCSSRVALNAQPSRRLSARSGAYHRWQ
jgi:hypothetical protein